MKTVLTRTLCLCLALLCLLTLAACAKSNPQKPTGKPSSTSDGNAQTSKPSGSKNDGPLSPTVSDKPAAITEFVTANKNALDGVVTYITGRQGLSYFYFIKDNDGKIFVEELHVEDGSLVRNKIEQDALNKLAATGFTGEVSFNSENEYGTVSCFTYISGESAAYWIVYCPDDKAVTYLTNGFIKDGDNVSSVQIVDKWYYVEAK